MNRIQGMAAGVCLVVLSVYVPSMAGAEYFFGKKTAINTTNFPNYLSATRFQTASAGTVNYLVFYNGGGSTGDTIHFAIYSDNGGAPSLPLNSLVTATGTISKANGWNVYPISPLAVNAGTYYWIAVVYFNTGTSMTMYDGPVGPEIGVYVIPYSGTMESPFPASTPWPVAVRAYASDTDPNWTPTATSTGTITPTLTISPTFTQTRTPTFTATPSSTPTPSSTATPSDTPTLTSTRTITPTQTITPSGTPTSTATPTLTRTVTPTFTATRTITPTFTRTATGTKTATPTISVTHTITPTLTSTITMTPVFTPTPLPGLVAYPMPASGDTAFFAYNLPKPGHVTIDIYNVAGEKVKILEQNPVPAGYMRLPWAIRSVAPAVYLYRMTIEFPDGTKTVSALQKIVVVKK